MRVALHRTFIEPALAVAIARPLQVGTEGSRDGAGAGRLAGRGKVVIIETPTCCCALCWGEGEAGERVAGGVAEDWVAVGRAAEARDAGIEHVLPLAVGAEAA